MSQENQNIIKELKSTNNHFARLFNDHAELDSEIEKLEKEPKTEARLAEIETKKRRKLQLKDKIYAMIKAKENE